MIITCVQCSKKIDNSLYQCPHCNTPMTAMQFDSVGVFTESLKGYSKDEILLDIEYLYEELKGTSKYYPALGYNGAIEMAALLLLIDFAKKNNKDTTPLFFAFGIACNGAPAGKWSDFMDLVIAESKIITSSDWAEAYCYLKAYYFDDINMFEFAKTNYGLVYPEFGFRDVSDALNKFRQQGMNV